MAALRSPRGGGGLPTAAARWRPGRADRRPTLLAPHAARRGADRAPAAGRPRPPSTQRPNVVLVVLDDFSMDLLRTMRSARTMRARGASYPHSFVVDSLCCVSRASTFTGQYPHQTGVRTNVAEPATTRRTRVGGWPAFEQLGNRERTVAVRLQAGGLHDRLRRQVPQRVRVPPGRRAAAARRPGWDDLRVVFGSAYDGWDFYSSRTVDGRPARRRPPRAAGSSARGAGRTAAYAGTVIERRRAGLHRAARGATPRRTSSRWRRYAPHSRVNAAAALRRRPALPAGLPRPAEPGAARRQLRRRRRARRSRCATCRASRDPQGDNRPRRADGRPRPRLARRRPRAPRRRRPTAHPAQPGPDGAVGRPDASAGSSTPSAPDTYVVLTSDNGFHLGQHGLRARQGHAVHHRRAGAAARRRPRRRARAARGEMVTNLDLAPTLEDLAGLAPAPYRSGRVARRRACADRGAATRDYVFLEHTRRRRPRPATPTGRDELGADPVVRRRPQPHAAAGALRPRPRAPRTSYVYELYDLTRDRFEQTNVYARPEVRRRRAGAAAASCGAFDACSGIVGNEPVRGSCRTIAAAARP